MVNVMRDLRVKDLKDKFGPFICQEFMQWAKNQDPNRWQIIERNRAQLADEAKTTEEFEKYLADFETIWLCALADYRYFITRGGVRKSV